MSSAGSAVSQVFTPIAPSQAVRTSLILVSYNSWTDLQRCLPSLFQDDLTGVEVILVDNASTDGTPERVEQAFPQVRLVRSPVNLGFGGANNLGVQQARGERGERSEFLAFLNPDTAVEPGWLSALIAALEADPSAGMATSQVLLMSDPGAINTCGNQVHLSGITLCRGAGRPRGAFPHVEEVSAISGAAFAVRRDLFQRLGGFDADFFMYMEDTDLSLRARLAGYKLLSVPDSVVYHAYRLSFGPRKTYYQERNRYRMLLKVFKPWTLLILLPALLLAEAVTWGYSLLRNRPGLKNKLDAYAWLLAHWGEVLAARREVQKLRRCRDRDLLRLSSYRLAFEQTAPGALASASHWLFDPLFWLCLQWARLLVWG